MIKNLILTGMMGVGKSTIGKSLAVKLSYNYIDVDKIIEDTKDISKVEQKAKLEGRQMTLIIQPN